MKKVFCAVLAIVLCVSLVSCSPEPASEPEPAPEPIASNLSISAFESAYNDGIKDKISFDVESNGSGCTFSASVDMSYSISSSAVSYSGRANSSQMIYSLTVSGDGDPAKLADSSTVLRVADCYFNGETNTTVKEMQDVLVPYLTIMKVYYILSEGTSMEFDDALTAFTEGTTLYVNGWAVRVTMGTDDYTISANYNG